MTLGSDSDDNDAPAARYKLFEAIGAGSCGTVYRALDTATGQEVAVKEVDFEEADEIQDVQQEVTFLRSCRSPNILKYHGSVLMPGTSRLRIAMEIMAASVADLVAPPRQGAKPTPLPEPAIAYILREVLNALVYLHSEHRIHRDIKAANVLLSEQGMVKVSDFGVAAQTSAAAKRRTFVGSPLWMAPEVIQQSPDLREPGDGNGPSPGGKGGGYDEAADIWSLGITAIEMALGKPPRSGIAPARLLFLVVREPPPQLEGPFSEGFKDFVWSCLRKSPADRPAAIDLLMHPFVLTAQMPSSLLTIIKNFTETHRKRQPAEPAAAVAAAIAAASTPPRLSPVPSPPGSVAADDGWNFSTVAANTLSTPGMTLASRIARDQAAASPPPGVAQQRHRSPSPSPAFDSGTVVVSPNVGGVATDNNGLPDAVDPSIFSTVVATGRVPPPAASQHSASPFDTVVATGRVPPPPPSLMQPQPAFLGTVVSKPQASHAESSSAPFWQRQLREEDQYGGGVAGRGRKERRADGPSPDVAREALAGMVASLDASFSPSLAALKASGVALEAGHPLGSLGNFLAWKWKRAPSSVGNFQFS